MLPCFNQESFSCVAQVTEQSDWFLASWGKFLASWGRILASDWIPFGRSGLRDSVSLESCQYSQYRRARSAGRRALVLSPSLPPERTSDNGWSDGQCVEHSCVEHTFTPSHVGTCSAKLKHCFLRQNRTIQDACVVSWVIAML